MTIDLLLQKLYYEPDRQNSDKVIASIPNLVITLYLASPLTPTNALYMINTEELTSHVLHLHFTSWLVSLLLTTICTYSIS